MREIEKKAKQFAYEAHKGMKRKGKDTPFTYHLELVNKILKTLTTDEEILAAGWLHDVVEDTPITLDELKKEFNAIKKEQYPFVYLILKFVIMWI